MEDLKWAMQVGIFTEPAWYPGLSYNSSADTFPEHHVRRCFFFSQSLSNRFVEKNNRFVLIVTKICFKFATFYVWEFPF